WAMTPTFNRLMPNFSHGTAGVAYFLATLYQQTKNQSFLDAAIAGAKYLQAISTNDNGGSLVFHHETGGETLFFLGWCHGPVGTARLYFRLFQITKDRSWMDRVKQCAQAIVQSGIPEKRTPGFWDNDGQCCGSAGVAEFFLDLHRETRDQKYLTFARRMADEILRRGTRDDKGARWRTAEHRIKPELITTQTGY